MHREVGKLFFILFLIFLVSGSLLAQPTNPNGYNRFHYENGKLSSEGYLKDGKPDGYWKNYYLNGNIKIEGNRKNFQLDSIWKFYDEKGHLTRTISYEKGTKTGPSITYDTLKNIVTIETYSTDVKEEIGRA